MCLCCFYFLFIKLYIYCMSLIYFSAVRSTNDVYPEDEYIVLAV